MDITEIQDELLRLEYPYLLPDHDPDIERYYYLRSTGKAREAMVIYQNKLKVRYPDDEFRTWLLRCYRSRDPAFRGLLARGYRTLGARSLERVKQIILVIAERAESYDEKDVYSTIKTAEDILRFLPPERYEATAGMERFFRYASALHLKVESIAKATELVRAYLTDTLSVVEEERRRRSDARRQAMEMERQRLVKADWDSYQYQKRYGGGGPVIDLSAVVFSPADLARIEIPPFNRVEDQVLGYCIKYWNTVNDPAFERILFLYSRKYGKRNYDVFMAIRRGLEAGHRDDEILASIMGLLVTGYYYSIQGDMYLQRNWNVIKTALKNQQKALAAGRAEPPEPPKARRVPALPAPAGPKIAPKPRQAAKPRPTAVVARQAGQSSGPAKPVRVPDKLKPAEEPKTVVAAKPKAPAKPAVPKSALPRPAAAPPPKPSSPARPVVQTVPAKSVPPVRPKPAAAKAAPSKPAPPKVFNGKTLAKAKGSVSDRLRELSGRSYDIYQDRFLSKSRAAIRKVLTAGRGLFFNLPEEAEDMVYNFLQNHYSDPYMDWEDSPDRERLFSMGFDLPSLNPVIDECYKTL